MRSRRERRRSGWLKGDSAVVDREVIESRLRMLEEAVSVLTPLKSTELDAVRASIEKRYVLEHAVQRALQAVLDIGSHILAEEGVAVDDYRQIIERLGERKVLPPEFARRIVGMASLRNLLVHQYGEIDHALLLAIVRDRLADFEEFAAAIREYIGGR